MPDLAVEFACLQNLTAGLLHRGHLLWRVKNGEVFPFQFLSAIAVHFRKRFVQENQIAVSINNRDAFAALLHGRGEKAQRTFRAPALGDVTHYRQSVLDIALSIGNDRAMEVGPHNAPVLFDVALFKPVARDLLPEHFPSQLDVALDVIRMGESLKGELA